MPSQPPAPPDLNDPELLAAVDRELTGLRVFREMPSTVLGRWVAAGDDLAISAGVLRGLPSALRVVAIARGEVPASAPVTVPAEGLLTTAQAAALLGVSARSVTRMVRRGQLRSVRVGGLVRFRRADLEAVR